MTTLFTTSIDQIISNYPLQNVRFFYVNVLIPVGAGACAALLIAFLVVLCRCCRRRKLKKVRYFGKVRVVANNIIIILVPFDICYSIEAWTPFTYFKLKARRRGKSKCINLMFRMI